MGILKGESVELEPCNQVDCPRWDSWGSWTVCSASCGGGVRQRSVPVRVPGPILNIFCLPRSRNCFHGECGGEPIESQACNEAPCQEWQAWSSWSACSATCGPARRTRSRACANGHNCPGSPAPRRPRPPQRAESHPGNSDEFESCAQAACPAWDFWSAWSGCSVTCGIGFKQRTRTCLEPGNAATACIVTLSLYGMWVGFEKGVGGRALQRRRKSARARPARCGRPGWSGASAPSPAAAGSGRASASANKV